MKKWTIPILLVALAVAYVVGWYYVIPEKDVSEALAANNKSTFSPDIFPITDSLYDLGTSTKAWRTLTVDQVCLTGDSCETSWPAGSASLSGGSINTLTYWTADDEVGATSSPTVGYVTATSTTATSTFAGGISVASIASTVTAWLADLVVSGSTYLVGLLDVTGDTALHGNLTVTGTSTLATTTATSLAIQDWTLATSTVVCMAPEVCQFQADGVDDDVQIQEAINSRSSGATVYIKAATYNITSPISMQNNVILIGEGWGTIIKPATNVDIFRMLAGRNRVSYLQVDTKVVPTYSSSVFVFEDGYDYGREFGSIDSVTITQTASSTSGSKGVSMIADGGSGISWVVVNNLSIIGGNYGIYMHSNNSSSYVNAQKFNSVHLQNVYEGIYMIDTDGEVAGNEFRFSENGATNINHIVYCEGASNSFFSNIWDPFLLPDRTKAYEFSASSSNNYVLDNNMYARDFIDLGTNNTVVIRGGQVFTSTFTIGTSSSLDLINDVGDPVMTVSTDGKNFNPTIRLWRDENDGAVFYYRTGGATNIAGLYIRSLRPEGSIFFQTDSPSTGVGNNTRMTISPSGNVGIGTTSPYSKLSVNGQAVASHFTATTSSTSTLPHLTGSFISGYGLSTCDPTTGKLTWANGVFGCGTDQAGSGGSGVTASSTATYVVYKLGSTYYAYNATTTAVTSGADFDVLLQGLVDTLDGGRAGGIIHIKSGDYYANATTSIAGNDSGSYNNGGRVTIQGDGTDSTRIIMYGNADFLDFEDAAIFSVKDLSVYVTGGSNGFVADSNDNDTRAGWMFSFENVHVAATTTHTGRAFDLGNVFRGRFENIEMFGVHHCMRFRAEGTFNPGDFVLSRSFCELDNTANGISYEFTEDSTGFMNQVHFEIVEGIAQSTGATFIKAEDLSFATLYNLNAEQYDILVDQQVGSGVTYHFNYATHRTGAASLKGCRFAVNASGNTCEFRMLNTSANFQVIDDANTWGDNPNTFIGYIGADSGTASASSSGTTVYRDVKGYGTLDTNLAPGGLFGIFQVFGPFVAKVGATILGFLDIPSATNPTVDAEGEIAINTTAASSSLRYHDGTAERALYPDFQKTLKISTSTILALNGNPAATTTVKLDRTILHPITHTARYCETTTGTWGYIIGNGTASSSYVSCTTTGATATSLTNATFPLNTDIYIEIGPPSSNATVGTLIVGGRYDAD